MDKNLIKVTQTLTLKLTIRKQTYNGMVKSVSYCLLSLSNNQWNISSQSRTLLSEDSAIEEVRTAVRHRIEPAISWIATHALEMINLRFLQVEFS